MQCRAGRAACSIAPSISSPISGGPNGESSGLPSGKPAGVGCVQLDDDKRCLIFGDPRRPVVCSSLPVSVEMCGERESVAATRVHAMTFLSALEAQTR